MSCSLSLSHRDRVSLSQRRSWREQSPLCPSSLPPPAPRTATEPLRPAVSGHTLTVEPLIIVIWCDELSLSLSSLSLCLSLLLSLSLFSLYTLCGISLSLSLSHMRLGACTLSCSMHQSTLCMYVMWMELACEYSEDVSGRCTYIHRDRVSLSEESSQDCSQFTASTLPGQPQNHSDPLWVGTH